MSGMTPIDTYIAAAMNDERRATAGERAAMIRPTISVASTEPATGIAQRSATVHQLSP